MVVLTYGIDRPHALQTHSYAHIKISALGFQDIAAGLADLLAQERMLLTGIHDAANGAATFGKIWRES